MVIKKLFSSTLALIYALTLMLPLTAFSAEETNSNYSNAKRIPLEDVQRFSNAIGEIKKYYVKPVDDKELFDNAIRGMLTGLDPHSSYLNEEEFKELQTSTSGEFGGLGIEVTMEEGVVKVITPLVDTPAFKAGIKSGDYIIKLGKESVQGLSLKDAVNLMRGKPGTTIELTILRKGVNKPLTFDLIREVIQIKSVKSKMLSEGYGYIRLTQFQALTGKDMIKAIEQLKQQAGGKLKGLVLDLRNNPGGLLDSAIQVSDAFLGNDKAGKQEMIVYTEGRLPGSKFTALANPGDVLDNAPIVVLINNGSASASEIVAGALKDNKRAIILGTKSFGKGSVQTVLPLDGKTGIKLTTALYYTPSGVSIQAKGIIPDIVVEEVDVPKNAVKKDTLAGFTEADLNGHLINKDNSENTESKNNQAQTGDLIHEDYQLYAALTVLEGMALANR
ncbi:TPA: PDZ domain-containing protein [Legionella pneumophila]|uniref:S41 family peptidase n=1 Tax=Legionella sp. PATHC039 TaxID=2992042 RepID=UPI0007782EB6|nr:MULTISPECIES: S41 family peptidase [Legionella]HAT8859818.1 PDZ domain-containing protein [Legionella pneumophila subsp. pneumophila]MCW8395870.1 S41 family peptidase [Legionella sp. PATHC039]HAT7072907.1 PDZ domain-containing protein [Legionella pneumophila]HAT8641660.1 PDZ domain-containing protein [Legionella pneumophila]HAT8867385.1 PDZ domain-containing protein [Legionella pneumophila subsp. pneumophila]